MKYIAAIAAFFLLACGKQKGAYECLTNLKLTASSTTPTAGDHLALYAHNGPVIYYWSGPQNFAITKSDGQDSISFDNIKINQSGWYRCSATVPGCNALYDSIFIEVRYPQGSPTCNLTNNVVTGNSVPSLQASSVIKRFDNTWQTVSLYANGSFGYPTYTFLFNSYNGNSEPKDGIYTTRNVQSSSPQEDANIIFGQCQYSGYFFKTHANQKVYVSHVNGKLRIAFCNLTYGGDNGNSVIVNTSFLGQLTEN